MEAKTKELLFLVVVAFTLIGISILLNGCVSVTIPDSEWCGDMGPGGATCFHTLIPDTRDVAKPAWDLEREGMICTQSASFAAWKGIIEKLCHETKDCNYQAVKAFMDKASQLKSPNRRSGSK